MITPTVRVTHRESGTEMLINKDDFHPHQHEQIFSEEEKAVAKSEADAKAKADAKLDADLKAKEATMKRVEEARAKAKADADAKK